MKFEERRDDTVPVVEGDKLELHCESVGEKGDGICKVNGFVVIIPNAEVGETYSVEITKVLNKVAFGKIV